MRIGRYNVVSVLGHGAFGEVFHARLDGPMGFRKDVALKRLHPHLVRGNPAVVQALIDEARLGGLLRHPNIVESYEFEQDDGTWFLAMEFVDGVTLQLLAALSAEAGHPVPAAVALEIIEQICRGLDYAHSLSDAAGRPLRIVHRDLKPANLMLSREGVVKIMDFGMAKASSNMRDSTASGMIKGTPSYMSPEQVHATRAVSEASDLYAVGVMMFELILGRRLFEGETAVAVMFAVINGVTAEQVALLEEALPGAGPIFARCTAPEPGARWSSAAELGQAVAELRKRLEEPPEALRTMAVALLQDPARLRPDELVRRTESFNSYLSSVMTSFERMKEQQKGRVGLPGDDPDATGAGRAGADATRDAVGLGADATRDAVALGADATRDAMGLGADATPAPTTDPPPSSGGEAAPPSRRRLAPLAALAGLVALGAGGLAFWPSAPGPAEAEPVSEPIVAAPEAAPVEPVEVEPSPPVPEAAPAVDPVAAAPESAPAPKAPTSGGGSRAAASPAPVPPPAAAAAPAADVGTGSVLVKSSPWGRVSIDGKSMENTPLRKELSAGPHLVVVDCGECTPPQSQRFDVVVEEGAVKTVSARFEVSP